MQNRSIRIRIVSLILGCLVLAIAIHPWDLQLARGFRGYRIPGDLNKFLQLCESFAHVLTVGFLFACLVWIDVANRCKLWVAILFVAIAGGLANLAKLIVPRIRLNAMDHVPPEEFPTDVFTLWGTPFTGPWFNEETRSFPSGHSATALAVAIGLTYVYPRGKWFFLTLAIFACLQRVHIGAHYFTDVLGGLAFSLACAYLYLPVFGQGRVAPGRGV